jgi:hypothetical protein
MGRLDFGAKEKRVDELFDHGATDRRQFYRLNSS